MEQGHDIGNIINSLEEKVVLSNGREQLITPLRVGQIGQVLRVAKTVSFGIPNFADADAVTQMIAGLVWNHYDELIQILQACIGWDAAEINALEADDLLKLAAAVFKVNVDFFTQRLLPALSGVVASFKM